MGDVFKVLFQVFHYRRGGMPLGKLRPAQRSHGRVISIKGPTLTDAAVGK